MATYEPCTPEQEDEMRTAFTAQAMYVLEREEDFLKTRHGWRCGIESEVRLWSPSHSIEEIEAVRDAIVADTAHDFDFAKELGAAQCESRTKPHYLECEGFEALTDEHVRAIAYLEHYLRELGIGCLRVGADPLVAPLNVKRTSDPKYSLVPDWYDRHRARPAHVGLAGRAVEIDASIVAACNALQINVQASSFSHAIARLNYSIMLGPVLLALFVNAGYLGQYDTCMHDMRCSAWACSHTVTTHDTGMHDVRMTGWRNAFSIGTKRRIGVPSRYFSDIADYLDYVGSFPFINYQPDEALKVNIGKMWLSSRLKIVGNDLIIELRDLPTQPRVEDEMLAILLYIGRLHYSEYSHEPLLPIHLVRANHAGIAYHGSSRKLWVMGDSGEQVALPTTQAVRIEVGRALIGLKNLNMEQCVDYRLLAERLEGRTPVQRLRCALGSRQDVISREEMIDALKFCGMLV
jgi:hypothetical protein